MCYTSIARADHKGSESACRRNHQQVDNLFSQAIRLLGLIRTVTFSFGHWTALWGYTALCTEPSWNPAWNSIISSEARKLQHFHWQFCISLSLSCFQSPILQLRQCLKLLEITHFKCSEAAPGYFLTHVFNGSKYCPALLESVGLSRPNRISGGCRLFNVDFECRICFSAWCASAANVIDSDNDIFNGRSVTVNMVNYFVLLLHNFINCLNLCTCSKSNLCVFIYIFIFS
jgi:hypothetical protein